MTWTTHRVTTTDSRIGVTVHRWDSGVEGPRLVVLGGVHGDEVGGIVAAAQLTQQPLPLVCGVLEVIPVVHEAAHQGFVRTGPDDGRDLARTFPGDARGSATERLADLVRREIIGAADGLIDLHTSARDADLPLFAGALGVGPSADACTSMALAFGLEVVWTHPAVGEGRTLTMAEERGIPAMYVESPRGGVLRGRVTEQYVAGVLRVAQAWGMLAPGTDAAAGPPGLWLVGSGDTDSFSPAACDGFFLAEVELLARVHTGQRVGCILAADGPDPRCSELAEVTASADGHVVFLRTLAPVTAGTPLVSVCPSRPVPTTH